LLEREAPKLNFAGRRASVARAAAREAGRENQIPPGPRSERPKKRTVMTLMNKLFAAVGTVALAAVTVASLSCPSHAHDESAVVGDVIVENIAATPARVGEMTRVTFSVANSGADRVTVIGVRLSTGELSSVIGSYGGSHSGPVGGLPIAPGEMTNLDGTSAWIEVGPLKQNLAPGSIVPARVVFGTYEAPITLHVESSSETATERTGSSSTSLVSHNGPATNRKARC
jgi:hypothetical protein